MQNRAILLFLLCFWVVSCQKEAEEQPPSTSCHAKVQPQPLSEVNPLHYDVTIDYTGQTVLEDVELDIQTDGTIYRMVLFTNATGQQQVMDANTTIRIEPGKPLKFAYEGASVRPNAISLKTINEAIVCTLEIVQP